MRVLRPIAGVALAVSLLGVAACGGSDGVKVGGVVLLDGEPVSDASVSFIPEAGGDTASGFTDDAGRFEMYRHEPGDGVKPGKYKIGIIANGEAPPTKTISQIMSEKYQGGGAMSKTAGKEGVQEFNKLQKAAVAAAKKLKVVPAKYNDPNRSGFTADVPAQTEYKLELKKVEPAKDAK